MLYDSIKIKHFNIKNRIVMAPMCMYQSDQGGFVKEFHVIHYATRAMGGVGLIIQEATAINPDGRISQNDLGIWSDEHVAGLKRIVHQIHTYGAVAGIQINHAGRKAKVDHPVGFSAIPFSDRYQVPKVLEDDEIRSIIEDFKQAARRADEAGYDLLELHGAHGYLLCQSLSKNTNQRLGQYAQGTTLLKEVIQAVQTVWPKEKILALRLSATTYVEHGITLEDTVNLINEIKTLGVDIFDISSGGNDINQKIKLYPGYQLEFARIIKQKTGVKVIGGGLIEDVYLADQALNRDDCDMVFYGRLLLRAPYYFMNHAKDLNVEITYLKPYERGQK